MSDFQKPQEYLQSQNLFNNSSIGSLNAGDITVINNSSAKPVFLNGINKFQHSIPDFRNFIGREKLIEDLITTVTETHTHTIALLGIWQRFVNFTPISPLNLYCN